MTRINQHTIRELRSLLPARPVTLTEAKTVAEAQATTLLHIFDANEPPVDVSLLCEVPRLAVDVNDELHRRRLSGESGWNHGSWLIKVNEKDSVTRRRFTLAHEFKHVIDGPAEREVYSYLGNGSNAAREEVAEAIADHFAASLLMPRVWIARAVRRGPRDVQQLAALFMVSPIAMNRRLREIETALTRPDIPADSVRRYFRTAPPRRTRGSQEPRALDTERTQGGSSGSGVDLSAAPAVLTVQETCTTLRVSRWTVYRLIRSGQLQTIKLGRRRVVPTAAVRALVDRLGGEEPA